MATSVQMILALAFGVLVGGCANKDNVIVMDSSTHKPIAGARITPIYPSFSGPSYQTNEKGIAHIDGFGLPRGGYGVEVNAAGYARILINTGATAENLGGWREDNMTVLLQPANRP